VSAVAAPTSPGAVEQRRRGRGGRRQRLPDLARPAVQQRPDRVEPRVGQPHARLQAAVAVRRRVAAAAVQADAQQRDLQPAGVRQPPVAAALPRLDRRRRVELGAAALVDRNPAASRRHARRRLGSAGAAARQLAARVRLFFRFRLLA